MKIDLTRRQFGLLTLGTLLSATSTKSLAKIDPYHGRCLLTIHARGGWDVTLYCDPKENQIGAPLITRWSEAGMTQKAGAIHFAPVANNSEFFDQHFQQTLVINGVDTQTNAHQTGERHTWTGSASEGRPSLSHLFAQAQAPDLPLSSLNFGTFVAAGTLSQATNLSANRLTGLLTERSAYSGSTTEQALYESYRARGVELAAQNIKSGNARRAWHEHARAMELSKSLGVLGELLPAELPPNQSVHNGESSLIPDIETALLAFKSGLTAAASCGAGGDWDTHANGEDSHTLNLTALNESLIYLWQRAETLGLADRLTVVISSDFSRTPYYNSAGGKDHWPLNSYMIMDTRPNFGNRVIGQTDELQNGVKLSASTMQPSPSGTVLVPAQVHAALHDFLGISDFASDIGYHFPTVDPINLMA